MKRQLGINVLGLFLLISMVARAQSGAAPDEVIVRPTSALEALQHRAFSSPEATSVVDADQMRARVPQSLADALRNTPSVSVQQTTPGQGTIYVRGLSGRAISHSIDGVRLNMAFFRAGNNDYLGLVDPYSLSSVAIVPGATSVQYGSDALGGAVVMSTGLPSYRRGIPATTYQIFQSLASNPIATSSRLSFIREGHDWGAKGGFTYYQAGPIRPGGHARAPEPGSYWGLERAAGEPYRPVLTEYQQGTEFEAYASDLTLRARLTSTVDLVFRGQAFVRPELTRYDQITPRFKRDYPQRAEAGLRPMSRAMVSVTMTDRPLEGWYDTAEVSLAWQRIYEHRFQRNLRESCSVAGSDSGGCRGLLELEPSPTRSTEDNSSNALSLRAEARKTNAARSMSAVWGLDARYDLIGSSAENLDLQTRVRTSEDPRYPAGSSLSEAGVFAHSRVAVAPNMDLFAGVRGSSFHLDIGEREGAFYVPSMRRSLLDVVGSIGANWTFAGGAAWTVNAARGVRAPNIEDFAGVGQRAGGRFQVSNPDLAPEHSYTADTGVKLMRDGVLLQSFIFYSHYRDAITLAPTTVDGAIFDEAGDRFYQSANASSIDLYGFEGMFDIRLLPGLGIRGRALLIQGIQRNDVSTELPQTTPADRVPPVQAECGLSYAPFRELELDFLVSGRAPQRRLNDPVNLDDNRIPAGGTPGYVTYHVKARVVRDMFTLGLGLDNITNELVLEHGSGFYRPGFSVTASLDVNVEFTGTQSQN